MRVFLFLLVAGCSEAQAVAPTKEPPPAPVETAPRTPLGERLTREAASRPELAVRPQQLIDALAAHGVAIERHRQVLASPVEASYCEALTSARGLALSLCEYGDGDAAERGLARSKTTFDPMLPGRTLDTRVNTLLTVTPPADAEGERERELMRSTFAALQPTR